jgi:alanine racemase
MEKLATIVQPTIGILTNIGSAHDAGFSSREQKIREKLLLFRDVDTLIYESGQEDIDRVIAEIGLKTFSWSSQPSADLYLQKIDRQMGCTRISAICKGEEVNIQIPFSDAAAIQNAIHCWASGLYLGLAPEILAIRLAQLTPIAMRLELQAGRNGCTLINDSYNSDLQSLSIALDYAQQQGRDSQLTLILSDILQSGTAPEQLYREVAELIHQYRVDRLIGVGEKVAMISPYLKPAIHQSFFPNTPKLLEAIGQFNFQDETILIKGARPFAFETIARHLLPFTHRTLLEINLSAIGHNLRAFNALLNPDTRMMGMVKAAAYGSGSAEVARLLSFQGIQYLGVAYVDEGVELRQAGITLPIMVLNPEPVTFSTLAEYDLEPEVYSLSQVRALAQFTRSRGTSIRIHLKIDTGMRRLGFLQADLIELITLLQTNPQLPVASVFSHLAASEDAREDDFTRHQVETFDRFYEQLNNALSYSPLRHVLNSAGIARFPQYQMEMVRLGIGMYGVEVCSALQGLLRPAFRLTSRISQIRPVAAGESIGYGRRGRDTRDRKIATVSIGYADGLLRKAGNGRYAFRLHDALAPTVGNICMDMCMVDVTHIPDACEGDEILIFGEELPLEKLAEVYETIPYEVLTGISGRVKRVYIME